MKKLLIILSFISILITSCLNYVQDTTIYPDGSGKMQINYWMKFTDTTNVATILKLEIFNPDSVRKEFSSPFVEIVNITTYSDSTDSTVHSKY